MFSEDDGFPIAKLTCFKANFKIPVEDIIPQPLIIDEVHVQGKMVVIGLLRIERQGIWKLFEQTLLMMDL
jgi:hypothetical protein